MPTDTAIADLEPLTTIASLRRRINEPGVSLTLIHAPEGHKNLGRTRTVGRVQNASFSLIDPVDGSHGGLDFPGRAEFRAEDPDTFSVLDPSTGAPFLTYRLETDRNVEPYAQPARPEREHPYTDQIAAGQAYCNRGARRDTVTIVIGPDPARPHSTLCHWHRPDGSYGRDSFDTSTLADPTRSKYLGSGHVINERVCLHCDQVVEESWDGDECPTCNDVTLWGNLINRDGADLRAILRGDALTGRIGARYKTVTPELVAAIRERYPDVCAAVLDPSTWLFNGDYDDLEQVASYLPAYEAVREEILPTGQSPHSGDFEDRISAIAGPDESAGIYLLQKLYRRNQHAERLREHLNDGWVEITSENPAPRNRKPKAIVLFTDTGDWRELVGGRLLLDEHDVVRGVLPKRARTRPIVVTATRVLALYSV